jgi:cell division protein FtsQ
VLERRDQLGSPLQVIYVAPDGDLSLRTKMLGLVLLGSNERLLDQQLSTIALLSSSLPETLRGKASSGIDLSDPSKPELQLKPEPKQKTSKP